MIRFCAVLFCPKGSRIEEMYVEGCFGAALEVLVKLVSALFLGWKSFLDGWSRFKRYDFNVSKARFCLKTRYRYWLIMMWIRGIKIANYLRKKGVEDGLADAVGVLSYS